MQVALAVLCANVLAMSAGERARRLGVDCSFLLVMATLLTVHQSPRTSGSGLTTKAIAGAARSIKIGLDRPGDRELPATCRTSRLLVTASASSLPAGTRGREREGANRARIRELAAGVRMAQAISTFCACQPLGAGSWTISGASASGSPTPSTTAALVERRERHGCRSVDAASRRLQRVIALPYESERRERAEARFAGGVDLRRLAISPG